MQDRQTSLSPPSNLEPTAHFAIKEAARSLILNFSSNPHLIPHFMRYLYFKINFFLLKNADPVLKNLSIYTVNHDVALLILHKANGEQAKRMVREYLSIFGVCLASDLQSGYAKLAIASIDFNKSPSWCLDQATYFLGEQPYLGRVIEFQASNFQFMQTAIFELCSQSLSLFADPTQGQNFLQIGMQGRRIFVNSIAPVPAQLNYAIHMLNQMGLNPNRYAGCLTQETLFNQAASESEYEQIALIEKQFFPYSFPAGEKTSAETHALSSFSLSQPMEQERQHKRQREEANITAVVKKRPRKAKRQENEKEKKKKKKPELNKKKRENKPDWSKNKYFSDPKKLNEVRIENNYFKSVQNPTRSVRDFLREIFTERGIINHVTAELNGGRLGVRVWIEASDVEKLTNSGKVSPSLCDFIKSCFETAILNKSENRNIQSEDYSVLKYKYCIELLGKEASEYIAIHCKTREVKNIQSKISNKLTRNKEWKKYLKVSRRLIEGKESFVYLYFIKTSSVNIKFTDLLTQLGFRLDNCLNKADLISREENKNKVTGEKTAVSETEEKSDNTLEGQQDEHPASVARLGLFARSANGIVAEKGDEQQKKMKNKTG